MLPVKAVIVSAIRVSHGSAFCSFSRRRTSASMLRSRIGVNPVGGGVLYVTLVLAPGRLVGRFGMGHLLRDKCHAVVWFRLGVGVRLNFRLGAACRRAPVPVKRLSRLVTCDTFNIIENSD